MHDVTFDWQLLVRLATGKTDLAHTLLTIFSQELPVSRATIQAAFADKDTKSLAYAVHRLHGGCCYCGVPKLKALTQKVEIALSRHTPVDELSDDITAILQEIDAVSAAIEDSGHLKAANN